jgi:4-hydroxythreonine-4-phosphate dehydrogenase
MNSRKNPISKSYKIKVGITMGDPSGIGPEITLKAIQRLKGLADFVVIGDEWVLNKNQKSKIKNQNYRFIDLNNVEHKNFKFGKIKAKYGRASIEYIDKALELIKNRQIDCLVTCPVSKEAINLAGFNKFCGHTEYLAKKTRTEDFAMMLLNKDLIISLVTRHIPLREVSLKLSRDKIYKTILLTYKSLEKLFSIPSPRIVVCGLNPHASDNGVIGNEENKIIKPVLERLRTKLKNISGPKPSDVAISEAKQKQYDCVIAMYHDQALIPLKLLGIGTGVNLTLGLPFIRTSPLHGTAFDIAGKGRACADSLIEAIKLAVRCALNLKRD